MLWGKKNKDDSDDLRSYERQEPERKRPAEEDASRQIQDSPLCASCGEKTRDRSYSEDSVLCEDCRIRYSKLRVPPWVIGFLAVVAAVLVFSSLRLPTVLATYKTYRLGEEQSAKNEHILATYSYYIVLEEYPDSVPVAMKAIDTAMKAQFFDGAAYIFDNYLVGKSLNDYQYAKATQIERLLVSYYNTSDSCQAIVGESQDVEEMTEKLLALLDQPGIDKTYVYFLLGSISADPSQALQYLALACAQDDTFSYPLAYYGNGLRRTGDLQGARDVYRRAIAKNAYDAFALRGLGILEQLEGKTEEGMRMIQSAYEMDPDGLYMAESMIIGLCESGRRQEALALLEERKAGGHEFDPQMDEYLNNRISMTEYYGS